jgi:hypothetical protein
MGGMNGVPIHEALYSTVNHMEQIRSTAPVPTKSLSYVSDVHKGIGESIKATGQPPTQVFYCDQPQGIGYILYPNKMLTINL